MTPVHLAASAALDAKAAAIAAAKRRWLMASMDGSSAADVQHLYESYRSLVIAQVAGIVADGPLAV